MQNIERSDYIKVKNILCYTKIGFGDEERRIGQRLNINIKAFIDLEIAGKTNELTDTVSYVELSTLISDICKEKEYKLLEYLAQEITDKVFLHFPKIKAIELYIKKPHIPCLEFNGEASISIFRFRIK